MSCNSTRDIYLQIKPNTYLNEQLSCGFAEEPTGRIQPSLLDGDTQTGDYYAIPQYQLAPQNQASTYAAYAEAYAETLSADVVEMPEGLTVGGYTSDYLRAHIGSLVRVEFLLGKCMIERIGYLSEVGATYIVLDLLEGSAKMMCDIFSIKFVTVTQLHA